MSAAAVTGPVAAVVTDRPLTQIELELEAGQKAGARYHPAQRAIPVAPRGATGPIANDNAKASGVTDLGHDKEFLVRVLPWPRVTLLAKPTYTG